LEKFKKHIFAFVGGFLSTLIFHQGLVGLFHFLGVVSFTPFNMAPTKPLGVPRSGNDKNSFRCRKALSQQCSFLIDEL